MVPDRTLQRAATGAPAVNIPLLNSSPKHLLAMKVSPHLCPNPLRGSLHCVRTACKRPIQGPDVAW